jgi:hypothetical protein
MFGMLRNLARPIGFLGQKLKSLFSLGSKVSPIVQDARNVAEFVNIAPAGLRFRAGGEAVNLGQGFFNSMPEAMKYFKLPV